jgi:hypothetical protein
MESEIFESSIRSFGDLAGVFEYDGEDGYFFLFDLTKDKGKQCSGVISVNSADDDLGTSDIAIKWSRSEEIVGLYIGGRLWAAFDQNGRKFGSNNRMQVALDISDIGIAQFN